MAVLMPSEIARLVLGYLKEIGCVEAVGIYLSENRHLVEYLCCLRSGYEYPTSINGKSLLDILNDYSFRKQEECRTQPPAQPKSTQDQSLQTTDISIQDWNPGLDLASIATQTESGLCYRDWGCQTSVETTDQLVQACCQHVDHGDQTNSDVTDQCVQTISDVTDQGVQACVKFANQCAQTVANVSDQSIQSSSDVIDQGKRTVCDATHQSVQAVRDVVDRFVQTVSGISDQSLQASCDVCDSNTQTCETAAISTSDSATQWCDHDGRPDTAVARHIGVSTVARERTAADTSTTPRLTPSAGVGPQYQVTPTCRPPELFASPASLVRSALMLNFGVDSLQTPLKERYETAGTPGEDGSWKSPRRKSQPPRKRLSYTPSPGYKRRGATAAAATNATTSAVATHCSVDDPVGGGESVDMSEVIDKFLARQTLQEQLANSINEAGVFASSSCEPSPCSSARGGEERRDDEGDDRSSRRQHSRHKASDIIKGIVDRTQSDPWFIAFVNEFQDGASADGTSDDGHHHLDVSLDSASSYPADDHNHHQEHVYTLDGSEPHTPVRHSTVTAGHSSREVSSYAVSIDETSVNCALDLRRRPLGGGPLSVAPSSVAPSSVDSCGPDRQSDSGIDDVICASPMAPPSTPAVSFVSSPSLGRASSSTSPFASPSTRLTSTTEHRFATPDHRTNPPSVRSSTATPTHLISSPSIRSQHHFSTPTQDVASPSISSARCSTTPTQPVSITSLRSTPVAGASHFVSCDATYVTPTHTDTSPSTASVVATTTASTSSLVTCVASLPVSVAAGSPSPPQLHSALPVYSTSVVLPPTDHADQTYSTCHQTNTCTTIMTMAGQHQVGHDPLSIAMQEVTNSPAASREQSEHSYPGHSSYQPVPAERNQPQVHYVLSASAIDPLGLNSYGGTMLAASTSPDSDGRYVLQIPDNQPHLNAHGQLFGGVGPSYHRAHEQVVGCVQSTANQGLLYLGENYVLNYSMVDHAPESASTGAVVASQQQLQPNHRSSYQTLSPGQLNLLLDNSGSETGKGPVQNLPIQQRLLELSDITKCKQKKHTMLKKSLSKYTQRCPITSAQKSAELSPFISVRDPAGAPPTVKHNTSSRVVVAKPLDFMGKAGVSILRSSRPPARSPAVAVAEATNEARAPTVVATTGAATTIAGAELLPVPRCSQSTATSVASTVANLVSPKLQTLLQVLQPITGGAVTNGQTTHIRALEFKSPGKPSVVHRAKRPSTTTTAKNNKQIGPIRSAPDKLVVERNDKVGGGGGLVAAEVREHVVRDTTESCNRSPKIVRNRRTGVRTRGGIIGSRTDPSVARDSLDKSVADCRSGFFDSLSSSDDRLSAHPLPDTSAHVSPPQRQPVRKRKRKEPSERLEGGQSDADGDSRLGTEARRGGSTRGGCSKSGSSRGGSKRGGGGSASRVPGGSRRGSGGGRSSRGGSPVGGSLRDCSPAGSSSNGSPPGCGVSGNGGLTRGGGGRGKSSCRKSGARETIDEGRVEVQPVAQSFHHEVDRQSGRSQSRPTSPIFNSCAPRETPRKKPRKELTPNDLSGMDVDGFLSKLHYSF